MGVQRGRASVEGRRRHDARKRARGFIVARKDKLGGEGEEGVLCVRGDGGGGEGRGG